MSKTSLKTTVEWSKINWRKLERYCFKLQKRIHRAAQCGNIKLVRSLQKTLLKSWSAKCLAVRRVTQDNQGKKTAGIDGLKKLSPRTRLILVNSLELGSKAAPTKRVWIPKPGTEEKRPLGIPTIYDRALQALVKMAMEPEWEARFEPNSYGFRPGRTCHDAVQTIWIAINQKPKFVLDADIAKCFNRINHEALLSKISTFPKLRRQIKAWLKAGVMDKDGFQQTIAGTPQGGVISPLLANIALHGIENRIKQAFPEKYFRRNGVFGKFASPNFIRYADDFVILHEEIQVIQKCQQIITEWLNDMGLELKPSKTRITHTLNNGESKPGFDFLGFNIRQFKVGLNKGAKNARGHKLGIITLSSPAKESLSRHIKDLAETVDKYATAPQEVIIANLNPKIRGWCNYYSMGASKSTFQKADFLLYQKLRGWALRRCAGTNKTDTNRKYWRKVENQNWSFCTHDGIRLVTHSEKPIKRFIKVQGTRSPYDGDWVYWGTRMGNNPDSPKRVTTLLKRQKGKCLHCKGSFKYGDVMEVDHITPKSKGGKEAYTNLQLLHRHCHDIKSALDGTHEKSQYIEEPDE